MSIEEQNSSHADHEDGQVQRSDFSSLSRFVAHDAPLEAQVAWFRREHERLAFAQEVGKVGTYEWDIPAGRILWTPELEALYGLPSDEPIRSYEQWLACLHEDDRQRAQAELWQAVQEGKDYSCEFRVVHPDGSIRWILSKGRTRRDEAGNPQRMIGVNIDITERRGAEKQIEWQAALLREAYDAFIVHTEKKAIFWNKGAEHLYGWSEGEAVGRHLHQLLQTQFPIPLEEIHAILKERKYWEGELVHARRDGTYIIVMSRWILLEHSSTPAPVILEVNRDITELKQTINQLQEFSANQEQLVIQRTEALRQTTEDLRLLNDELERSNQELQQFAYVASHDLQEPLRKIQAFGNLLEEEYGHVLGEGKNYLDRMRNAASRMQILINDLLTFSRVTTKALPFVEVNLNIVAQEVVSDLETRIQEGRGNVLIEELPVIEADPIQMRQMLQNLLANALKFHKPDQPPIVRVFAEMESNEEGEEQCRIFIQDNGIGFDEKYLDRIFTVFQRLHGRTAYEGTGIGLAVVRKIVERHEGYITAKSAPEEGATFIVTLPVYHTKGK